MKSETVILQWMWGHSSCRETGHWPKVGNEIKRKMCVSVGVLLHGSIVLRFPVGELWKCEANIHPLSFTQLSDRLWRGHQMWRILAAIHKHDLLLILVSSLLFAFVSCGLWCARSSVYVWETAAKGALISVFHSFLPPLPDCQSFMLLCMNPAMFQQCSGCTQPWHFCGVSATPPQRQTQPPASQNSIQPLVAHTSSRIHDHTIECGAPRCVNTICVCVWLSNLWFLPCFLLRLLSTSHLHPSDECRHQEHQQIPSVLFDLLWVKCS